MERGALRKGSGRGAKKSRRRASVATRNRESQRRRQSNASVVVEAAERFSCAKMTFERARATGEMQSRSAGCDGEGVRVKDTGEVKCVQGQGC